MAQQAGVVTEIRMSIDKVLSEPLLECEIKAYYTDFDVIELSSKALRKNYTIRVLSDDLELYKRFIDKFRSQDVKSTIQILVKQNENVYLVECSGTYSPEYEVEWQPNRIYELTFELRTWGNN